MGENMGAWSLGCFYKEPHLKVVYITSIQLQCLKLNYTASKTAKSQEESFPYMSQMEKGIGSVNTKHSLSPCLPHYSPLWRIYSSGQTKFHTYWKAFLNHSKRSEILFTVFTCLLSSCLFTCHSSIIVFLFDYVSFLFQWNFKLLEDIILGFSFIQNVLLDKYCIKT